MENFHKYLIGLRSHYQILQQIIEMGNDHEQIELGRFTINLLDDIIHHFDMFVKLNNPMDNPNRNYVLKDLPDPPEPSIAIRGARDA